jgi:hypothetical protein
MFQQLSGLGSCFVENAVGFEQQQPHVSHQGQLQLAVLGFL